MEVVGLLISKRFSGTVPVSMYILEVVTKLLELVSNGMHYFACVDFLCSIAQACQGTVTGWLAKKFKTKLAEVHYNHCNSSSTV